jgi:hypothetical protein
VLGARLARFAEWWMHDLTKILYILVPNAAALPIYKIHMSEEPAPSLDLNGLVDEACACLDQYRKMDMPDSLKRTLGEAMKKGLQALNVRFQNAIRVFSRP